MRTTTLLGKQHTNQNKLAQIFGELWIYKTAIKPNILLCKQHTNADQSVQNFILLIDTKQLTIQPPNWVGPTHELQLINPEWKRGNHQILVCEFFP